MLGRTATCDQGGGRKPLRRMGLGGNGPSIDLTTPIEFTPTARTFQGITTFFARPGFQPAEGERGAAVFFGLQPFLMYRSKHADPKAGSALQHRNFLFS
jgi:hypothetical protein